MTTPRTAQNLFDRVWDLHTVGALPTGENQLFVGLHLIHEVTSPQAFAMLRERGLGVLRPDRTFGTVDHIVPTTDRNRPLADPMAEAMLAAIERNTRDCGITFWGFESPDQGIVHIIGPEHGLTQPGMIIACGDSHTSTHGAFGAIAFGIGTSQIRDVLATQTLAMTRPKVRKIEISGSLPAGVYAKDIILRIIAELGVNGGIGYTYEYSGPAIRSLSMEERMTICNMSIEGGARAGYISPDETTFAYLRGRPYAPQGALFEQAVEFWNSIASPPDAHFDDVYTLDISDMQPMVTWGINPGQAVGITQPLPAPDSLTVDQREGAAHAYAHMGFTPGATLIGAKIDKAFMGSCTNGRISDLRVIASVVKNRKVASHVQAIVVPGSAAVKAQAEAEGLDAIFSAAGMEWRAAGCSMCLAMNPDKLSGHELCASTSNRNFIGRQGSPTGRTLLMSPAMAAAAAVTGAVVDVREFIRMNGVRL
jgi:3-isopropylmalate/(R)-2-methylmalate dehydratase large subunit